MITRRVMDNAHVLDSLTFLPVLTYVQSRLIITKNSKWAIPGKITANTLKLTRRAMYGLKQAPRAWNKCLEAGLTKWGFVQSNAVPVLWPIYGENGSVMCMFYVDDGLAAARSDEEAEALADPCRLLVEHVSCEDIR